MACIRAAHCPEELWDFYLTRLSLSRRAGRGDITGEKELPLTSIGSSECRGNRSRAVDHSSHERLDVWLRTVEGDANLSMAGNSPPVTCEGIFTALLSRRFVPLGHAGKEHPAWIESGATPSTEPAVMSDAAPHRQASGPFRRRPEAISFLTQFAQRQSVISQHPSPTPGRVRRPSRFQHPCHGLSA